MPFVPSQFFCSCKDFESFQELVYGAYGTFPVRATESGEVKEAFDELLATTYANLWNICLEAFSAPAGAIKTGLLRLAYCQDVAEFVRGGLLPEPAGGAMYGGAMPHAYDAAKAILRTVGLQPVKGNPMTAEEQQDMFYLRAVEDGPSVILGAFISSHFR